jgi:hypothetical protein
MGSKTLEMNVAHSKDKMKIDYTEDLKMKHINLMDDYYITSTKMKKRREIKARSNGLVIPKIYRLYVELLIESNTPSDTLAKAIREDFHIYVQKFKYRQCCFKYRMQRKFS